MTKDMINNGINAADDKSRIIQEYVPGKQITYGNSSEGFGL